MVEVKKLQGHTEQRTESNSLRTLLVAIPLTFDSEIPVNCNPSKHG